MSIRRQTDLWLSEHSTSNLLRFRLQLASNKITVSSALPFVIFVSLTSTSRLRENRRSPCYRHFQRTRRTAVASARCQCPSQVCSYTRGGHGGASRRRVPGVLTPAVSVGRRDQRGRPLTTLDRATDYRYSAWPCSVKSAGTTSSPLSRRVRTSVASSSVQPRTAAGPELRVRGARTTSGRG